MHLSSSFAVILCTLLISQYVYCSPKRDEQWWHNLTNLTGLDTRQINRWTTAPKSLTTKSTPKVSTIPSNQFLKRSSVSFNDGMSDSPIQTRSRNWEKSYARRRDYDRTWKDDQPVRERFSETEWDDDVPVRHVFRDSTSSIDEGPVRNRFGDELPREKMSRPWSTGDSSWRDSSFNSNRNNNNNNKNNRNNINSNKPKATTTTLQQPKSDRTDRVLNLNFQDEDSKRKDKERLDQLAKQIFGSTGDDNEEDNFEIIPRTNGNTGSAFNGNNGRTNGYNGSNGRSNGNNGSNGYNGSNGRSNGNNGSNGRTNGNTGNGYVRNAMNTFTRNNGNTYSTTTGSDFSRSTANDLNRNTEKQTSSRFPTTNAKPIAVQKPKFNVVVETTPAKPERTSNTAKPIPANDIRGVAEKPKSSTTPSAPLKFGWRSSISHSDDQKNQKLQNNVNDDNVSTDTSEDEDGDDFEDEFGDNFDDTTTTRAPTTATTKTTTRPVIRTTVRPTTMRAGVEYTTYRQTDTTRPQTTTSVTNRPTLTTSKPKAISTFTQTSPKSTTNGLSDNLAPNKKQHRMGSWVDSETLDYIDGGNQDWSEGDAPPADNLEGNVGDNLLPQPQPLIGNEEFENEQLPERVEEALPIPQPPISDDQKFARQSARDGDDEREGERLEDALPGVPGTDYPTFAAIPRTAFDCRTHEWPGYYADVETQCQVFHICQAGGRKNSFLCPNGTMFNQQVFVCDWWHNVQCGDSPTHYPLNEKIYDNNWESKRINSDEGTVRRSGSLESAEPLTATTTETPETDSGLDDDRPDTDSFEKRSDSDPIDNNPIDETNNDFVDENNEETEKAPLRQRVRTPIRIYRTSRIITDPDRQKRRRRKRQF